MTIRTISSDRLIDWNKLDNTPLDTNSEIDNLQAQIDLKTESTDFKTINGESIIGSGDLSVTSEATVADGSITESKLSTSVNISLDKADSALQSTDIWTTVQAYSVILDGTTASFTTADETKLDTITGTNTGDDAVNSLYSGLVSNATHTGDVTGSTLLTIANGVVSLAKMASVATWTLFYRKTAGSWAPEVQTLATLKTDLGLTGTNSGDQTTIVGITGTKAQFDTAVTDGNFMYIWDEASTVATINGKISAGTNVSLTGTGTTASPYVINASGGGGVSEELVIAYSIAL